MDTPYSFRRLSRKIPTMSRHREKASTLAYPSPSRTPPQVSTIVEQVSTPRSPSPSPSYTTLSTTASEQDSSNHLRTQTAFLITITGVLLDSTTHHLLPSARETLRYLSHENIPYMLLASGSSARSEEEVASHLSTLTGFRIPLFRIFFPYTPFRGSIHTPQPPLTSNILVLGSPSWKIKALAEGYGFTNVYTAKELAKQVKKVKVTSILVFNQAKNWKGDVELVVDLVLSSSNEDADGDEGGEMPFVYWCEDVAEQHSAGGEDAERLSLQERGFRAALEAAWCVETGKTLDSYTQSIPLFLEGELFPDIDTLARRAVYLIDGNKGGQPLCRIAEYETPFGIRWTKVIVQNGQDGADTAHESVVVARSVEEAVMWSLANASNDVEPHELPPQSSNPEPGQYYNDSRTDTTTTDNTLPGDISFGVLPDRPSAPVPGQHRDDSRTNTTTISTSDLPEIFSWALYIPPLNPRRRHHRDDSSSSDNTTPQPHPYMNPLYPFTEEFESQLSLASLLPPTLALRHTPPHLPPTPANPTVLHLNKELPALPWEQQYGESADRPHHSDQQAERTLLDKGRDFITSIDERLQELRESRKAFHTASMSKKMSFGGNVVSQEIVHRSWNAEFASLQDPVDAYGDDLDLGSEQGKDFTLYSGSEWSGLHSARGSEDNHERMSWPAPEFSPILGPTMKR